MENAHLTKAHEHVRNAAAATQGNSMTAACEAHSQAAVSFQEASRDAHDAEAVRILALLEDHHRKLAQLIKEPPSKKGTKASQDSQCTKIEKDGKLKSSPARPTSPSSSTLSPTRAPSRRRLPHSSIASNLAEKRGIPGARKGTAPSSSVSVATAVAARSERQATPVRDLLEQQSKKAQEASKALEASPQRQKETPLPGPAPPPPADGFKRFYSAFGGVINAISAPLAFTSLPLSPSTPTPALEPSTKPTSPSKKQPSKPLLLESPRTVKSSEPDLSALISKPALNALRSAQPGPLGPFAKNESFYLVPTSGGTVSYASMLRDPQAHAHHLAQDPHLASIAEGDDTDAASTELSLRGSSHEEFVDARESIGPGPPSPHRPRSSRNTGANTQALLTTAANIRAGRGHGIKTMEELQLENETLRAVLDKQAKRLTMWETTSQSSYNALAQSLRARGGLRNQSSDPMGLLGMTGNAADPPAVPSIPAKYQQKSDDKETKRIADLEAQFAEQAAKLEALEKENRDLVAQNEKQGQVIGRYREQWEKLKAGARKKEKEKLQKRAAEEGVGDGKEEEQASKEDEEAENEAEVEDEAGAGFGKA
ncbi:hypothetical protein M011DRAFT_455380 [Sporormia fimetaria CBS 119925]|uniref:Uncharacterized protein n=1 Tax=Sporormia fimetaria CBS 119925 TaxID=1340428 RepID=A0A6A6VL73_9PLEO|nr:hypothetical protein M011DRAFT_455380 [Sporormia fimetaria CBS 119925]